MHRRGVRAGGSLKGPEGLHIESCAFELELSRVVCSVVDVCWGWETESQLVDTKCAV